MSVYKVTFAHAVSAEDGHDGWNGKAKAGNQNGRELRFQDYYISGNVKWDCVLRAKDEKARETIAFNAINAVKNSNIGYDQSERYTLYDAVKNANYDVRNVTKPCECDCSTLATVCSCYAGIDIPKDTRTANMQERYKATKKYHILKAKKWTENKTGANLQVGDMCVKAGHHVAIVCNTLWWLKSTLKQSNAVDRVKDVKALQCRLNELGNYGLVVDGEWGAKTQKAVVDFQFNNQLEADGIVGKATASVLGFLYG